ncbi:MAG: DUF3090 domain-containing protein [Candidatus Planktophila sp.]
MIRIYKNLSRFTVGTIGMPGERTFFIQFRKGTEVISASIEKSQVAALSERIHFMLKEIRLAHPLTERPTLIRDSLPLDTPVIDEFRIGSIAIFYDEESGLIQIDLRELNLNSEEIDEDDASDDVEVLRIYVTATQALIFSDRADLVVAAGRQPCPFCGLPIDPQGHLCARANGYRR